MLLASQLKTLSLEQKVERPVRWLAGFAVAAAEPGAEAAVEITIRARALEHWDTDRHGWTREEGTFALAVGRSSADLALAGEVAALTVGG